MKSNEGKIQAEIHRRAKEVMVKCSLHTGRLTESANKWKVGKQEDNRNKTVDENYECLLCIWEICLQHVSVETGNRQVIQSTTKYNEELLYCMLSAWDLILHSRYDFKGFLY